MPRTRSLTSKMITDFCRLRLKGVLDEQEVVSVSTYLIGPLELMAFPPYRGKWIDWADVSVTAAVDEKRFPAAVEAAVFALLTAPWEDVTSYSDID